MSKNIPRRAVYYMALRKRNEPVLMVRCKTQAERLDASRHLVGPLFDIAIIDLNKGDTIDIGGQTLQWINALEINSRECLNLSPRG